MVAIAEIVGFLDRYNALDLERSPWPSYNEDDGDLFQVDYRLSFPIRNQDITDTWSNLVTSDFIAEIEDIIRGGSPRSPQQDVGSDVPEAPVWDICAWYQPIHNYPSSWGIYIKQECLEHIARDIAGILSGSSLTIGLRAAAMETISVAFTLLYLHEHYHHKVETMGLRLTVVDRRPTYLPYRKKVYTRTFGTDECIEEALANASSYLRLNDPPYNQLNYSVREAAKAYLRSRFPKDPPGYRMADLYLTEDSFAIRENFLQSQIREKRLAPVQPPDEWDLASHMMRGQFGLNDNIWIIVPPGSSSILPTKISPYSSLSSREAKLLAEKKFGFVEKPKNNSNNHIKLVKNGRMIVIPPNRPRLFNDVIKSYCATLGVRASDLRGLVNGL